MIHERGFDDDTFTDDRRRAEEIARGMGELGLTWSCNAKANVPYDVLKILRAMACGCCSLDMRLRSPQMMKRRLREGVEFVSFLRHRGT